MMRKEEINKEQYERILEAVRLAFIKNGVKATTMDSIATSLQMSKRTLYEIFGSKEEMFYEAQRYFHKKIGDIMKNIFLTSDNVMEAIIKCFLYNRDLMSDVNVEFIKDMKEYTKHLDNLSEEKKRQHYHNLYDVLKRGVEEGYFRKDINLLIQCHMLTIQMESLKSSEELFPKGISLIEIFDSIILSFLRGISTPKGLEELEQYTPYLTTISNQSEYLQ